MLLAQSPVLLLLLAGARRAPEAGLWARWVWKAGRAIIVLTAAINISWTAYMLWQSDYWNPWPELFLASCAMIDLAVMTSVLTSAHHRQVFTEFPPRPLPTR